MGSYPITTAVHRRKSAPRFASAKNRSSRRSVSSSASAESSSSREGSGWWNSTGDRTRDERFWNWECSSIWHALSESAVGLRGESLTSPPGFHWLYHFRVKLLPTLLVTGLLTFS